MANLRQERTFLMVKPDGVRRGLIGEIIRRVEQCNLKIIGIGMFQATREQIDEHYPKDEKWINRLGEKTMKTYQKYGFNAQEELGTEDTLEIGKQVRSWLIEYMTSAPLVKIVVEGVHAVDMVRKLVGDTIPAFADCGTIRGDFSVDSAASANREKRAIHNLVHASETTEEAEHEIKHWFGVEQINSYKRVEEDLMI